MKERNPLDYLEINWAIFLLQFASHVCVVVSRVVAIVVFDTVFQPWIYLIIGLHWLLLSIWLNTRKEYEETSLEWWEERLLNVTAALIYFFMYTEVQETENSRFLYIGFHVGYAVENIVFVIVWIAFSTDTQSMLPTVLSAVFGSFTVGVILMFMYFTLCYPRPAFSFEKMKRKRPRVLRDEESAACRRKSFDDIGENCPKLTLSNEPHSPPCNHKPHRTTPPSLDSSATKRSSSKLEDSGSHSASSDAETTASEGAPVDSFHDKERGKVLSEVPKLPSPPLFTKCPPRKQLAQQTWTDVYAQ